jgi:hypothetical protein
LEQSVPYAKPHFVKAYFVAQKSVSAISLNNGTCLKLIDTFAVAAFHSLAVSGDPCQWEIASAVRTDAVIGHGSVEVSAANDEAYLVVGTKHVRHVALHLCLYAVALQRGLAVIALHADVAEHYSTLGIVLHLLIHIDVVARTAIGREHEACGMHLIVEIETARIAVADDIVFLAARGKHRHQQSH